MLYGQEKKKNQFLKYILKKKKMHSTGTRGVGSMCHPGSRNKSLSPQCTWGVWKCKSSYYMFLYFGKNTIRKKACSLLAQKKNLWCVYAVTTHLYLRNMRQLMGKGEGTDIFSFLCTRCSQVCNIFLATVLNLCHFWPTVPAEQPLQGMTPKHAHAPCSSKISSYLEPWRVHT